MKMYGAFLLACLAFFFWPEQNIAEVPFAALTLKLIASVGFALWLSYCALKLACQSLVFDAFWPWHWTRRIVTSLSIRALILGEIGLVAWASLRNQNLGLWLSDHALISGTALFIAVSLAICAGSDDVLRDPSVADTTFNKN
jgi:hypothetical protein